MIVILEGLEGTGKTTLARALQVSHGLPTYRAFRTTDEERFGGNSQTERLMERLGVPVNTYMEDLFVADLLAKVGGDVVLDRSMPSGVAYGIEQHLISEANAYAALEHWIGLLEKRKVLFVYLECSALLAEQRAPGRRGEFWISSRVEKHLHQCCRAISSRLEMLCIDTTSTSTDGAHELVVRRMEKP